MRPDDPRHGTYAGFHKHRRDGEPVCDSCNGARLVYDRRMKKQRRRGWKGRAAIGPIRRHLLWLRDQGMTWDAIAAQAGCSKTTVRRAAGTETYRAPKYLVRSTAARLLAVQPAPRTDGSVPALGSVRRVRALAALGWPVETVAQRIGWTGQNLRTLANATHRQRQRVSCGTHQAIAAAYGELCMTLPEPRRQVTSTRNMAQRKGWLPPLAYDDIDNDPEPTPDHTPDDTHVDPVAVIRRMNGDKTVPLNHAERVELVRQWRETGRTMAEGERVTGIEKWDRYRKRSDVA